MSFFSQIRTLWIAIAILILINFATLFWLFRFHGHPRFHRDSFDRHPRTEKALKRALDLSREQEKMFREVQKRHREKMKAEQKRVAALKKELRAMAFQDSISQNLEEVYEDIAKAQAEIEKQHYEHLHRLYQNLDDEQRRKFRRLIQSMERERRAERKKEGLD